MITILINPAETRRNPIALGKAGETGAVQVIFDLEDFIDLYGEGIPILLFLRPGETVPYEPEITVDDSSVYWTITDTETVEGTGTAEFQWYTDSTVVKSNTYTTVCLPSLASILKDSTVEQTWLDELAALAAEAKSYAEAAAVSQEAASDYADAASDSADAASESALAAANSETAAASSEENAADSASAAAESALAAADILETVQELADSLTESGTDSDSTDSDADTDSDTESDTDSDTDSSESDTEE